MAFYKDRVYPQIVRLLGDPDPFRHVRRRIVPLAQGTALEIGVGAGANFLHYDPARVERLYALEPNPGMARLAERQRRRTTLDVRFLGLPAERIPLESGSVDAVVSTFTLCTIPGVVEAIQDIHRVLRPTGTLIFFEHGLSPDARIRRWQRRTEPVTRWLFEGCHVTRDVPPLLEQNGFRIREMDAAYLSSFPKSWTYCWWGTAVPQ
jgi:SAM-dependent methyltransferase